MIALESLTHASFAPLVGQRFKLSEGEVSTDVELVEAKVLGGKRMEATREPFALLFRGAKGVKAAQGVYHFEHEVLGAFDMFITQVGNGAQGSEFEAIFT